MVPALLGVIGQWGVLARSLLSYKIQKMPQAKRIRLPAESTAGVLTLDILYQKTKGESIDVGITSVEFRS